MEIVPTFNQWLNESSKTFNLDFEVKKLNSAGYTIIRNSRGTTPYSFGAWMLTVPSQPNPKHPINLLISKVHLDDNKIIRKEGSADSTTLYFYSFKDRESFAKKIRSIEDDIKLKDLKYKYISIFSDGGYIDITYEDVRKLFKSVFGEWDSDDDRIGTISTDLLFEKELSYETIWQKAKEWGFPVGSGITAYNQMIKTFNFYVVSSAFEDRKTYDKVISKFEEKMDPIAESLATFFKKDPDYKTIEYSFFERKDADFFLDQIKGLALFKVGLMTAFTIDLDAQLSLDDAKKFYDIYFGRFDSPDEEKGAHSIKTLF